MMMNMMIVMTFSDASQYSIAYSTFFLSKMERDDLPISPYALTCAAFIPTRNTQDIKLITQGCHGVQYSRTSWAAVRSDATDIASLNQ